MSVQSARINMIPGFVLALLLGIIILAVYGFARNSRPSEISSKGMTSVAEKVKRLEQHFELLSKVKDTEFKCVIRPSMLGPSRYDDYIAVKVAPSDIPKWLGNYSLLTQVDGGEMLKSEGINELNLTGEIWRHSSAPQVYINGTETIYVFLHEGILIMHLTN